MNNEDIESTEKDQRELGCLLLCLLFISIFVGLIILFADDINRIELL